MKEKKPNSTSVLWVYFTLIIMAIITGIFIILGVGVSLLSAQGTSFDGRFLLFEPFGFMWIISIVLGASLSLFVGKRIVRPIENLRKALKKVAEGDFSFRLPQESRIGVIEEINDDFNTMAEELSGVETLRNDFVANVSHEFKTPLAAIEGYATLLQNKNLTDERREEYAEKIIANVHSLSEMTGNILKLSKLENQDELTDKKFFALDEQIRLIVLNLENEWSAKNIELDIDLQTVTFLGNEGLLAQVWDNLINNAIKFSYQNGKIEIHMWKKEEKIFVTVKDYGCGMSQEVQRHIFDKFYQADKTHSSKGNGLGLALVKKIVQLCNGEIFVESKEGEGSTFTVVL